MTNHFTYDFINDYQKPSQWRMLVNYVGGISLLLFGVFQFLSYIQNPTGAVLFGGICATVGGSSFLLMALNGNKPFMKEGQVYLKVDKQNIYTKLNKYAPERIVCLDEIVKMNMESNAIILRLQQGNKVWIDTHKIQNKAKKAAFITMMKAWQL